MTTISLRCYYNGVITIDHIRGMVLCVERIKGEDKDAIEMALNMEFSHDNKSNCNNHLKNMYFEKNVYFSRKQDVSFNNHLIEISYINKLGIGIW